MTVHCRPDAIPAEPTKMYVCISDQTKYMYIKLSVNYSTSCGDKSPPLKCGGFRASRHIFNPLEPSGSCYYNEPAVPNYNGLTINIFNGNNLTHHNIND